MKRSNSLVLFFALITIFGLQSCKDDSPVQVIAFFSSDKAEILVGETVTFTDNSEGGANSWKWTFDNGIPSDMLTSTEQNPQITFNNFGKYTITLEVGNGGTIDIIKSTTFLMVDAIETIYSNFGTGETAPYDDNGSIISDYQQGSSFNSGALASGTHKIASLEFGFKKWEVDKNTTYEVFFCPDNGDYPDIASAKSFGTFSHSTTTSTTISVIPNTHIEIDANTTYWFVLDIKGTHGNNTNGLWLSANVKTTGSKRAYRRSREGQTLWNITPSTVSSMRIKTRRSVE